MSTPEHTADVSVIGLGRVGLPLALSFADRGLRVVGIDNDPARLDSVREGVMPFQETGAQELLERVTLDVGQPELPEQGQLGHSEQGRLEHSKQGQLGHSKQGRLEHSKQGQLGRSKQGRLELSERVADAARRDTS